MPKQLKDLNISDLVKFGRHQVNLEEPWEIIWCIAAKNHTCIPAYPDDSITLLSDKTIDLVAMDAKEIDNPDFFRQRFGNNNFGKSNILQWLNSDNDAGEWYTPQHEYDAPPDTNESISNYGTHYAHKAGFQKYFSNKEKNSILQTTIRSAKNTTVDGGGYDDLAVKIFLPSNSEVGLAKQSDIAEGSMWEIFTDAENRKTSMAPQAYENTLSSSKPPTPTGIDTYWLRTSITANTANNTIVKQTGELGNMQAYVGAYGIRPAFNLPGDTLVSDEPDEEGCYTFIFDKPPVINAVPSGDLGVRSTPLRHTYTITDPDNDLLTVTEKLNDEVIRTLTDQQSGVKLTLDLSSIWQTLPLDTPYTATVEVTDSILTTTSEWTFTRSNAGPSIITESSGDLGKLALAFKQEYTVNDPNNDTLTITEILDGQTIRNITDQPSGSTLTFDLTDQWAILSKDIPHTATVELTDGLETTTHTWVFNVIEAIQQGITVTPSSMQPTSVVIPVLPVEVLVANNANDDNPVWEDASKEYLERKRYSFKNNTKTAAEWRVAVKYNVNGVTIPIKLTTSHEIVY